MKRFFTKHRNRQEKGSFRESYQVGKQVRVLGVFEGPAFCSVILAFLPKSDAFHTLNSLLLRLWCDYTLAWRGSILCSKGGEEARNRGHLCR